ncbi:MAG: YhcH/YjgK/YiaL family protein [Lachnospiraceae bacterium]|nr:YhcH/YjgK/YiaL family protein [Lachnospiraceae bacterium]
MIFDSIKNKENYKDFPLLYQALCFLDQLPAQELPAANTVLIENQLFCNPVTLISKPEPECIYEAHRNYIDLHYIVTGVEKIATSDITTLSPTTPYAPEKDIEFLNGEADGYYTLKPRQFMVCFPNDAHKVAIMKDHPTPIQKIVFKIKAPNQK